MLTNTRSKPACSGNCNKLVVFHVRQGHGTARARGVQVDVSAIIEASFPQLASRLQWLVRPHVFRLKCLVLYLFKIVAKGKVLQSQYIERVALGTLHRNEHKETDTLSGRRTMLWVQSSQGSFRFFFFCVSFCEKFLVQPFQVMLHQLAGHQALLKCTATDGTMLISFQILSGNPCELSARM